MSASRGRRRMALASRVLVWLAPALLGGMLGVVRADDPALAPDDGGADAAFERFRLEVNPEYPTWSPAYVLERCAEHLATINSYDRERIRYFDLSGVPRGYLPSVTAALLFGAPTASRAPLTVTPRPVPNTDNRLLWIDLGWYNWTTEAWEAVSTEEPYFREPIVPPDATGLNYLRSQTRANAVVRADWFLWYVFDNVEFLGANDVFNEKAFYYRLVYASVTFEREVEEKDDKGVAKKVKKKVVGVGPATAKEFQQAWRVDFDVLKDFPIDQGAMVDEGQSGVSYSNRVLWRIRTATGRYWRTFDVFRTAGDQDFVENPFPHKFDAGEHIFQDDRGAQYYLLSNAVDASVDFGDPRVVNGCTAGGRVLTTSFSCIHCHITGILSFRNEHLHFARSGAVLKAGTPDRAYRFEQFFLQEKRMARLLKEDQDNYAGFVKDCNGLTAVENVEQFRKAREWYMRPVTAEQGARELGCSTLELTDALGNQATKGRLGRLALDGHPIPRRTWERGLYAEAGLLLSSWRKSGKMTNR